MVTYPFRPGQSKKLRQGRISEDFACYAISKSVNHRCPVLATPNLAQVLMNSWQYLRSAERIKLFAFCIMPDHYHVLFCLLPDEKLSKVMEDFGKFTSRQINKLISRQGQFWEEGFYDHRCRNDIDLYEQVSYMEHNPVRRQLVQSAELWPFSSAFAENKYLLDRDWWP